VLGRLVTARPGRDPGERLREVTHRLAERRDRLAAEGIDARVAAFSSPDPSRDLLKLAHHQDADLILLDGARALLEGRASLADDLLAHAPADVGLYLARQAAAPGSALLVPFSGSEHDWAALELAAHIARHGSGPLVLAGSEAPACSPPPASSFSAPAVSPQNRYWSRPAPTASSLKPPGRGSWWLAYRPVSARPAWARRATRSPAAPQHRSCSSAAAPVPVCSRRHQH
jgi:hypothetical protein